MKSSNLIFLILSVLLFTQCGDDDASGGSSANWLVPIEEVRDGGPGKDGIPSIDDPQFDHISTVTNLDDDALVVVSKLGDQVYIYSHEIMDWHEIVNHFTSDGDLAMTYCPLTGTAIGWNANVNGRRSQFGVSGLLYNSNLMPYDRATNSTWSQMRLDCVNGASINTRIELMHLMETTFATAKSMFPDALSLNTNTGINRSYGVYPYGSYRTNTQLIFPVDDETDSSLHLKERVLGVQANGSTIAFTFDSFDQTSTVVKDAQVGGTNVVAIGNKESNFLVAFENNLNNQQVNLSGIEMTGEGIAQDDNGNIYNGFGEVISGPNTGSELTEVVNYIGYWFAWDAFGGDVTIIN